MHSKGVECLNINSTSVTLLGAVATNDWSFLSVYDIITFRLS